MTDKQQHLVFIQGIIKRMGSNSFLLKGWSITLLTGLIALSRIQDAVEYLALVAVLIFVFWLLDAYYLSLERQFRALYDSVRKKSEGEIDYDLNPSSFNKGDKTWFATMTRPVFIVFYGGAAVITLLFLFLFVDYQIVINL